MLGSATAESNGFYVRVLAVGSGNCAGWGLVHACKCKSKAVGSGCGRCFRLLSLVLAVGATLGLARRDDACVSMYEKPLFSAVVPRTGATDIPRVGWLLGNTPLWDIHLLPRQTNLTKPTAFSLYIHGALLI